MRLGLYRLGWLKTKTSSSKVISVGNLTVGGSGKTPVTELLARRLTEKGMRVAVLTRGYGSKGKGLRIVEKGDFVDWRRVGDEPAWLARRLPEIGLFVDADRQRSASVAEKTHLVLIMDDGFQHLGLERDLNLALFDCEKGLENDRLFPAGPLREPLSSLSRADAVLLTKTNLSEKTDQVRQKLKAYGVGRFFVSTNHVRRVETLDGKTVEPATLAHSRIVLVSGIGNPRGFEKLVALEGIPFEGHHVHPDHHPFEAGDLERIRRENQDSPPDFLLVTEKDAVKLERPASPIPILKTVMEVRIEDAFWKFVEQALPLPQP